MPRIVDTDGGLGEALGVTASLCRAFQIYDAVNVASQAADVDAWKADPSGHFTELFLNSVLVIGPGAHSKYASARANVPTETLYRFTDRTMPHYDNPKVTGAPLTTRVGVAVRMLYPRYRDWRANQHMGGVTEASPYGSVAVDPNMVRQTTDPWLATIATGEPGLPSVRRAPDIAEMRVPIRKVIVPRPGNRLSLAETERVIRGNPRRYVVKWHENPFWVWLPNGEDEK